MSDSNNHHPLHQVQKYQDSCIGCYMYEHALECRYLVKFFAEICPCQNCLVKIMCEVSCSDFDANILNDIYE